MSSLSDVADTDEDKWKGYTPKGRWLRIFLGHTFKRCMTVIPKGMGSYQFYVSLVTDRIFCVRSFLYRVLRLITRGIATTQEVHLCTLLFSKAQQ